MRINAAHLYSGSPWGKERYISIESPNAIPGDDPVYLQVGSYPTAKLYKAQQSSTFARDVMTIMNFIGMQRDQFLKTRLEEGFGEAVAINWTPKARTIDMIVHSVATKRAGYKAHHDGKYMLCDDEQEGYARRDMWIPTLVFQNSESKVACLVFTEQISDEPGIKPTLGEIICHRCTLHEQGRGTQASLLHEVVVNSKKAPENFLRWTLSGRPSQFLQKSGLLALRTKHHNHALDVVKCTRRHGVKLHWNKDYEELCSVFNSLDLGSDDEGSQSTADSASVDVLPSLNNPVNKPKVPERTYPFGKWEHRYILRPGPSRNWPTPPYTKMLKIPMSTAEFFIDGRCGPLLNKYHCCLSIVNRTKTGELVTVRQAPLIDRIQKKAVPYGHRMKLSVICRIAHVTHTNFSSQPWSYDYLTANGAILYHPYKNQIPTTKDNRGPTVGLGLIFEGKARIGFYI